MRKCYTERSIGINKFRTRNNTLNNVSRNDVNSCRTKSSCQYSNWNILFWIFNRIRVRYRRFKSSEGPQCQCNRRAYSLEEWHVLWIPFINPQRWAEPEPAYNTNSQYWNNYTKNCERRNSTNRLWTTNTQCGSCPDGNQCTNTNGCRIGFNTKNL